MKKEVLMAGINAGIIMAVKFCNAANQKFASYIDYIDRDNAVRNENMYRYNLYQDYMDDPEKTTGLFTLEKDSLNLQDKKKMKELFQIAQENGSLMWQPVISFDNRWLEKQGLYDPQNHVLDEMKIKEYTRKAISQLLKKEDLSHAVWNASIHYNTDNIHVHVSVVEPVPMRKQKEYQVYEYIPDAEGDYIKSRYGTYLKATEKNVKYYSVDNARYKRSEVMRNGKAVVENQYVGVMKESSIESAKSILVNGILNEKEYSIQINKIIRENIVRRKKEREIRLDPEFQKEYLELYRSMPTDVTKNLWSYNSNVMAPLRPQIDQLSLRYIEKYHPMDYQKLLTILEYRNHVYQEAYGDTKKVYSETIINDLFTRLGNALLLEIKDFDTRIQKELDRMDEKIFTEQEEGMSKEKTSIEEDFLFSSETDYKKNDLLYNKMDKHSKDSVNPDWKQDNSGVEVAQYKLGVIYTDLDSQYYDMEKGIHYLKKAAEHGYDKAMYFLGKIFLDKKNEFDFQEGERYLKRCIAKGNTAAKFFLAKEYLDQNSQLYNPQKGMEYITKLANEGNQYAQVKLAIEYIKGAHIEKNFERSNELLQVAARQGNTYAAEILEYSKALRFKSSSGRFGIGIRTQMINAYQKSAFQMDRAIQALKKSMDEEYAHSHFKNQQEYEHLADINL